MSAVGKEEHFSFFVFFFFFLQGTSFGLSRTNHTLLSLVDTNLMQYTCMCPATDEAVLCTLMTVELAVGPGWDFVFSPLQRPIFREDFG